MGFMQALPIASYAVPGLIGVSNSDQMLGESSQREQRDIMASLPHGLLPPLPSTSSFPASNIQILQPDLLKAQPPPEMTLLEPTITKPPAAVSQIARLPHAMRVLRQRRVGGFRATSSSCLVDLAAYNDDTHHPPTSMQIVSGETARPAGGCQSGEICAATARCGAHSSPSRRVIVDCKFAGRRRGRHPGANLQ